MTHGTASTRGHCAGNGGLRGHSVGDVFPCVIVACGMPDSLTYQVWYPNGDKGRQWGSYQQAHDEAAFHLEAIGG